MNIELPSNTPGISGRINYTNDYQIKLSKPIDGLNREAYIEVTNVMYPNTICNISDNENFYFSLVLTFENFSNQTTVNGPLKLKGYENPLKLYAIDTSNDEGEEMEYAGRNSQVTLDSNKIIISKGNYNLKNLLSVLNDKLSEYNINFIIGANNRIKIIWDSYYELWLNQTTSNGGDFNYIYYGNADKKELLHKVTHPKINPKQNAKNLKSFQTKSFDFGELNNFHAYNYKKEFAYEKKILESDDFFSNIKMELNLSDNLRYMLGFSEKQILLMSKIFHSQNLTSYVKTWEAKYLPDIRNGINKIFLYCDQVETTIIGNTSAELLSIIPLEKELSQSAEGEIISYEPPLKKIKFKKDYIQDLRITLKDSTGKYISFNYGTVNIEAIIK